MCDIFEYILSYFYVSKHIVISLFFFTSHLQQSPGHMLRLTCKAKYGYEYLYVELSKQFNMKVNN